MVRVLFNVNVDTPAGTFLAGTIHLISEKEAKKLKDKITVLPKAKRVHVRSLSA